MQAIFRRLYSPTLSFSTNRKQFMYDFTLNFQVVNYCTQSGQLPWPPPFLKLNFRVVHCEQTVSQQSNFQHNGVLNDLQICSSGNFHNRRHTSMFNRFEKVPRQCTI